MTRVQNAAEAAVFRAAFWARRDERGRSDGPGSFRERFQRRVEAADRLYAGPRRGSLTDQGRALLLLGAPGGITVTTRSVLSLEDNASGTRRLVRSPVEVWRWRPDQLPRRLLSMLGETARTDGVEVRFDVRRETSKLIEGETLLRMAARALVVRAPATWEDMRAG